MGRFSGLAAGIANVADKLRKEREMGAETGQKINLLGVEGLMKGTIAPAEQGETGTTFDLPGMGTFKPKPSLMENVTVSPEGELAYKVGDAFIPLKSISKNSMSVNTTNKGGKTLIAPMIDKISKNEDAYYTLGNSLAELQTNADKFSQFMGPGKQVLRNPIRSYVNKDLQDFLGWKANVQDAFQQYRVAVTGAQASDKEIALLAKNRPTENDTYDVFVKKTDAVRKIGNQVITRYINNLSKSGYNVSGFQDTLDNLNSELGNLGSNQPLEQKQDISEEDIQYTLQKHPYLTREQLFKKLGVQ